MISFKNNSNNYLIKNWLILTDGLIKIMSRQIYATNLTSFPVKRDLTMHIEWIGFNKIEYNIILIAQLQIKVKY